MKKLGVRFDTEKVNAELMHLAQDLPFSRSEIARVAMNVGIKALNSICKGDEIYNTKHILNTISENK